jgi:hypothetical protein
MRKLLFPLQKIICHKKLTYQCPKVLQESSLYDTDLIAHCILLTYQRNS